MLPIRSTTATPQLDVRSGSCRRVRERSGSNSPTNLAQLLHPASEGAGQRAAGSPAVNKSNNVKERDSGVKLLKQRRHIQKETLAHR